MAEPAREVGSTTKGRTLGGQPLWLWGVGAVVVVAGYLYLRRKQAPAASSGQQRAGQVYVTPTGFTSETLTRWIKQHQGPPRFRPGPPRVWPPPKWPPPKNPHDDPGPD